MADGEGARESFLGFRWGRDLGPRIVSSLVLLAIALTALVAGGIYFAAIVGLVYAGTYREWETMISARPPSLTGNMLSALMFVGALAFVMGGVGALALVAAAAVLGVLIFGGDLRLWRIIGIVFFFAVIAAILLMRGTDNAGIFAGLFLGCTIWLTDTGAYFAGRQIGGAKLSPDISPSKTWSGAIGGLVTGSLCALIVWLFSTDAPWWLGLGLGIVLSVIGQLGDLAESALKRRFRIKDSGDIIPGHGGLMDRLDSLSFAALTLGVIGAAHAGLYAVADGFLFW